MRCMLFGLDINHPDDVAKLSVLLDFAQKEADSFSIDILSENFWQSSRTGLSENEDGFLAKLDKFKIREDEAETYKIKSKRMFYRCQPDSIGVLKDQMMNLKIEQNISFQDILQNPAFYSKGKMLFFYEVHEDQVIFDINEDQYNILLDLGFKLVKMQENI